jgi:hypothetical protein
MIGNLGQDDDGLEIVAEGEIMRILGDDNNGSRHQRLVLRLSGGQTVLLAHNIDLAPRLDEPQIGALVSFKGVYAWNLEGGVVHMTHLPAHPGDPEGWLRCGGKVVQ